MADWIKFTPVDLHDGRKTLVRAVMTATVSSPAWMYSSGMMIGLAGIQGRINAVVNTILDGHTPTLWPSPLTGWRWLYSHVRKLYWTVKDKFREAKWELESHIEDIKEDYHDQS